MFTYTVTQSTGVAHNGSICHTCGRPYVGVHTCSVMDLCEAAERAEERAKDLRRMARERFESLGPALTIGPDEHRQRLACLCRCRCIRHRHGMQSFTERTAVTCGGWPMLAWLRRLILGRLARIADAWDVELKGLD